MIKSDKIPIILYDDDNPSIILSIIMVSDAQDVSTIKKIVKDIKQKYPGEWTLEDILLKIIDDCPEFDIYNSQDIFKYGI